MARVKHISQETIKALAGIIDFYYWKGIPCARKWPDWTHFKPSPRQKASMEAFKKIRADLKKLQIEVVNLWRQSCIGKGNSWVDLFTFLWFQFWKNGIDPAPVLKRYRITETIDNIFLYMDFTAPVQSHIIIGDGFYKATRRITIQKGKPQPCHNPPRPKPPKRPIPPEPIEQEEPIEEPLWFYNAIRYNRGGYAAGDDYSAVVQQAWANLYQNNYTKDPMYAGAGIETQASCTQNPGNPPYYQVWVGEYICWIRWDYENSWKRKHPGIIPDILKMNSAEDSWDIINATGTIEGFFCEGKEQPPIPVCPKITIPAGAEPEIFTVDFIDEEVAWDWTINIKFQPGKELYGLAPPKPQPKQTTYARVIFLPAVQKFYAIRLAGEYYAEIPREHIEGLSQPTAFIYSHDMPAVAPPIPLTKTT
jgi:hypothetical protein